MSSIIASRKTNINNHLTGGGSKKQGLAPTTNKGAYAINAIQQRGLGENRKLFFCLNQLGGIGPKRTQFSSNAGGTLCRVQFHF